LQEHNTAATLITIKLSEFSSKLVLMFYVHAIMYVNTRKEMFICQARIEILSLQVPNKLCSFNRFCNL